MRLRLAIIFTSIFLCMQSPAAANEKQIQCLANVIFYEARSESIEGKRAVAHVVINRTESKKFPNTVCKVVSQKGQFSWYPKPNVKDKRALAIARRIFSRLEKDNTYGSLFFHSISVNPRWKRKRTIILGRHIFYK